MEYIGSKAFENEIYKNCLLEMVNGDIFSTCKSEEDIRKKFEAETNRILQLIGALPKNEYISFSSEVATENGRRIDSKYKNIIIEYKKYKRLNNISDHQDAIKQLTDYLNDSQFEGKSVYGILFDGYTMEVYHKDEHGSFSIPNNSLNGMISAKSLDYYFKIAFLRNKKEINSFCLREDFQINSPTIKETFRLIYKTIQSRTNPRTTLMLNEWEKMFKLSENDSSSGAATHPDILERRRVLAELAGVPIGSSEKEYMAIFSLHTLFSIILKLLLCKSVNEFKNIFNGEKIESICLKGVNKIKNFFISLENGTLLKKAGLVNMLEGDFFSWYTKEESLWNEEFLMKMSAIISIIAEYEEIRIKTYRFMQDLFRELYEAFIPHIIRHCFGEYYTPYWLAENVMLESTDGKDVFCSVMDPCCGSGTFLISAINRRIEAINKDYEYERKIDFDILTKGIYGIDLNPLAVLMARINIFINVAPYINDYLSIEIPIYNGDSTYSPTIELIDGVRMLSYSLNTTIMGDQTFDITLPYDFVNSCSFISVIDKLEEYILVKNEEKSKNYLISEIKKIVNLSSKLESIIKSEVEKLIDLEKRELNGIWLRIFANYLKTGVLPKIDCIIGNPPWVRWNVLPENYRLTVKSKCKLDGLFSDDTNSGGVDLNICALIANKCCEKWLSKDGRLSFLMPQSLLVNKSFEGFRRFEIEFDGIKRTCYFESITNWTKAGNPFGEVQESFCTYHVSFKKQDYLEGIMEKYYIKNNRRKLRNNSSWLEVQNSFDIENKVLCVFSTKNNNNFTSLENVELKDRICKIIGENEYNFRKGVDAQAPMRLTFKRNVNDNEAEFYTWKKAGFRLRRTNNTVILETKFIKPFISAPMIEKNQINWNGDYVICTYKETKKPVSMDILRREAPRTAAYLSQHELELSNRSSYNQRIQNNEEYYALLRMGEYSFFEDFVVIRDNSKFVSCHISKIKTNWNTLVTPIFDSHVSYISEKVRGKNEGITFNEAKYINAILNMNVCELYIINSVSLRSIGTRFNIRIPKYQETPPFKKFLEKHRIDPNSTLVTEKAYFELLESTDKLK